MSRRTGRALPGVVAQGDSQAEAGDGPGCGERVPGAGAGGRVPLRDLMDDRLLDALLERSRDEAGGLRLTGEGSMLGELVAAVPGAGAGGGADCTPGL